MYQDVRDGYAVYFFKEEAEAPVLELCETKDYVIDQRISLEMPETARAWTAEDGLERFLSESGAYVKLVLRFTDDLDTETYAEYRDSYDDIKEYVITAKTENLNRQKYQLANITIEYAV